MDSGGTGGIAVYLRVSTEEQKQQGTIETQRAVLERYLAALGTSGASWYEDDGVTGTIAFANRPSGRRLMDDIRAGRVSTVIVRKLDRFGRNAREILNATHALEQAGARLVSIKESVDTSTSAGRFFLTVLAGIAELERDTIMERTSEGMARRLTDTTWMGGHTPYGYRVQGKRKDARLIIDDTVDSETGYSEADVYRLCWHLLVEQDWTSERIAGRLAELGITARKGGAWAPGVVYRMLADPCYMGERVYRAKDGSIHSHPVPALISREQYERARAALSDHRRYARTRSTGAHPYLLRGMLRCDECGELYTTNWSRRNGGKGERHRYYVCSTRYMRKAKALRMGLPAGPQGAELPSCGGASVDAERAEAIVWAGIMRWIEHPGEALHELAAQRQQSADVVARVRAQLADNQHERDALQAERDKIFTFGRKGLMTETDMARQLADLSEQETGARLIAEALEAQLRTASDDVEHDEYARSLLQRMHARLDSEPLTPALQREYVEVLVRAIRVITYDAGTSKTGNTKRRAKLEVAYRFKKPTPALELVAPNEDEDENAGTASSARR